MPYPSEDYAFRAREFAASKKRIQDLRALAEALIAETGMGIAASWQIAREIDREVSRRNAVAARDDLGEAFATTIASHIGPCRLPSP
jgi:hypothetical protein